MKALFLLTTLFFSQLTLAQNNEYFDDLDSIPLRIEASETPIVQINYPGYRMNGGTPASIRDCLYLDIMDSDHTIPVSKKLAFANSISVRDGFMHAERTGQELKPVIKGTSVVFPLKSVSTYMTHIQANVRGDGTLLELIQKMLLPSKDPTSPIMVNLLYVRGCRL